MILEVQSTRERIEEKLQYYHALCQEALELQSNILVFEKTRELQRPQTQPQEIRQRFNDDINRATLLLASKPNGRQIEDIQLKDEEFIVFNFQQDEYNIIAEYGLDERTLRSLRVRGAGKEYFLYKGMCPNKLNDMRGILKVLAEESEIFSTMMNQFLINIQF